MKYVLTIITIIVQFIVGYLVLFFGAMFGMSVLLESLGLIGPDNVNPWWNTPLQFISFVLAASFGVWLVGRLVAKMRKIDFDGRKAWWGTVIGSAVGILIIAILYITQGAVGFMPVLFALIGALVGYYSETYLRK
jgi:hypothetical protein